MTFPGKIIGINNCKKQARTRTGIIDDFQSIRNFLTKRMTRVDACSFPVGYMYVITRMVVRVLVGTHLSRSIRVFT
jgi:hypothetical protein